MGPLVSSLFIGAIMVTGTLSTDASATNRLLAWNAGDASIEGVGDISANWVLVCAGKIPNPYWESVENRYSSFRD